MISRRLFMASGCACLAAPRLLAAPPDLPPSYKPQSSDERGMWMQMAAYEEELRRSQFVIRDKALNDYVRGIVCRLVGPHCPDIRVYIVRTPQFNASMAPNGMMEILSGLLLRMQSEAQLAAVLGHEIGHYLRQHSLKLWRDVRSKGDVLSFLGLGLAVGGAYQLGQAAQLVTIASIYGFSREAEREADAVSLPMLRNAGYDPRDAARVWQQLIAEQDATARARGRKRRDRDPVIFATHPTSEERLSRLAATAATLPGGERHRERYMKAIEPYWVGFIDDQVKLNDFGGTSYLLDQLGAEGWRPILLYGKGELHRLRNKPGDLEQAADYYRRAVAMADPPPEAFRGLGYTLIKLGQRESGKAALQRYLALAPDAKDRAIVAAATL